MGPALECNYGDMHVEMFLAPPFLAAGVGVLRPNPLPHPPSLAFHVTISRPQAVTAASALLSAGAGNFELDDARHGRPCEQNLVAPHEPHKPRKRIGGDAMDDLYDEYVGPAPEPSGQWCTD